MSEKQAQILDELVREKEEGGFLQNEEDALRAGAAALRATAWLDIESAPKDGTKVLLTDGSQVSVGGWLSSVDQGADEDEEYLISPGWWSLDALEHFTHWMHLPIPPASLPETDR